MKRRHLIETIAVLAAVAILGCSGEPSPLSPTPDQDPERHARAGLEMEAASRRNREAEAQFYRNLAVSRVASAAAPVAPESDHDPNSSPNPPDKQENP